MRRIDAIKRRRRLPTTAVAPVSFNLAHGKSLGDAVAEIERAKAEMGTPDALIGRSGEPRMRSSHRSLESAVADDRDDLPRTKHLATKARPTP